MLKNRGAKQYTSLTLKEKMCLLELSEKGASVSELCVKFNTCKSHIYGILKRKSEFERQWHEGVSGSTKRQRKPVNEELNALVWEWFVSCKAMNFPVTGPILQAQAKEIATQIGCSDFKASNGWLESFKRRHDLGAKRLSGASDVNKWKEKLPQTVAGYEPHCIYTCDETVLLFRALPSGGSSLPEDRLTILLCCSMDGQLEKPLVVGRDHQSWCLDSFATDDLPVVWHTSKDACMTAQILAKWLDDFNSEMHRRAKNVMLFLNGTVANPHGELSNVKTCWFPGTSQAFQQGLITSIKIKYRTMLLRSVVARLDTTTSVAEAIKSVTLLDVIHWISRCCNQITTGAVLRSFKNASFPSRLMSGIPGGEQEELQEMRLLIEHLGMASASIEEYVNVDRELLTDTEFILSDVDDEDAVVRDQKPEVVKNPIKTYKNAMEQLKNVRNFMATSKNVAVFSLVSDALQVTEQHVANDKLKEAETNSNPGPKFHFVTEGVK